MKCNQKTGHIDLLQHKNTKPKISTAATNILKLIVTSVYIQHYSQVIHILSSLSSSQKALPLQDLNQNLYRPHSKEIIRLIASV